MASTINYAVKVLWQILTINKREWGKSLTDFLGEYFWMKYFCGVTGTQKGHKAPFGPSKTPSGAWRYDGALCQMETASGAVVGRFTEVLHHFLSLPGVTSLSHQWHPVFGYSALMAGTSLSNNSMGQWEELSQRGILMAHWGQLVRKKEQSRHRTQTENGILGKAMLERSSFRDPSAAAAQSFLFPYCWSYSVREKQSWCVEEEKIFLSLKLWNILAEQYLNVNTNVLWCTEKKYYY